jgi:phosphotransferase system HPr (HPr) family protein
LIQKIAIDKNYHIILLIDKKYQKEEAMFKRSILINTKYGIHLRMAAEIVKKTELLSKKYNVSLYVKKSGEQDSINISILGLLSLRIKQGEVVEISCKDNNIEGSNAVKELGDFINNIINEGNYLIDDIDDITFWGMNIPKEV